MTAIRAMDVPNFNQKARIDRHLDQADPGLLTKKFAAQKALELHKQQLLLQASENAKQGDAKPAQPQKPAEPETKRSNGYGYLTFAVLFVLASGVGIFLVAVEMRRSRARRQARLESDEFVTPSQRRHAVSGLPVLLVETEEQRDERVKKEQRKFEIEAEKLRIEEEVELARGGKKSSWFKVPEFMKSTTQTAQNIYESTEDGRMRKQHGMGGQSVAARGVGPMLPEEQHHEEMRAIATTRRVLIPSASTTTTGTNGSTPSDASPTDDGTAELASVVSLFQNIVAASVVAQPVGK
jgi:hypothetical protein